MGDSVISSGAPAGTTDTTTQKTEVKSRRQQIVEQLQKQARDVTVWERGQHGETTGIDFAATAMARTQQSMDIQRQADKMLADMQALPPKPDSAKSDAAAPKDKLDTDALKKGAAPAHAPLGIAFPAPPLRR